MVNPRRIKLTSKLVEEYNLSTDPPPPNSLFWVMWQACEEIAQQAFGTNFIQGIGAGTLDPVKYGAFNVLDAYYCFKAAPDYLAATNRAQDPTLKMFLLRKYQSYEAYNQSFPQIWHIQSPDCIIPNEIVQQYSLFEERVTSLDDPIYCIPLMLPCEFLWFWLAARLTPPTAGNLYADWVLDNNSPNGAYAMGNFLYQYMQEYPGQIDVAQATQIYQQAMTYEFQNFQAAAAV